MNSISPISQAENLPNHRLRQAIAEGNISQVQQLVLAGERDSSGGLHSYIFNEHERNHKVMFELYEALFLNGHPYYFKNDDFYTHHTKRVCSTISNDGHGYSFERIKNVVEKILESLKDDPKTHAQISCFLISSFLIDNNLEGVKLLIPNNITQEDILRLYENSENTAFVLPLTSDNQNYSKRKEVVEYLIELFPENFWRGISKEKINDPHLIALAACHGDMEFIQWLIEKGSPINATPNRHDKKEYLSEAYSPLISALSHGHRDLIPELLKLGCDPNVGVDDDDRCNLIGIALRDRHYDLLDTLIQANTNIHHISRYNETPILLACRYGNLDNIKTLIEAGANIEDKDVEGYTKLLLACDYDNLETFIYLREAGADMEAAKRKGTTITSLVGRSEEGRIRQFLQAEELNNTLENKTPAVKSSKKKIGPRL